MPNNEFIGSHGTCLSSANNIKKRNFNFGNGNVGKGIYFWAKSHHYLELAKRWWIDQKKKGKYESEMDQSCAIILAVIDVPDEEVLDFQEIEFQDFIAKNVEEKRLDMRPSFREKAEFFSWIVDKLEKDQKITIGMFKIRVTLPESYKEDYPITYIGLPLAFVVRKKDYISITDIRDESKESLL